MKYLLCALLLSLPFAHLSAQSAHLDFKHVEQKEKLSMLRAYEQKNIPGFVAHLNKVVDKFNLLDTSDREWQWANICLKEDYYLLACLYAKQGYKSEALDYLEKAEMNDYATLIQDEDLDNIRNTDRFRNILSNARQLRSQYLTTLRQSSKYTNAHEPIPAFTYQSPRNANLTKLKKQYHLDSIAGSGTDVLQAINLMRWVHYSIRHDGSKRNPSGANAINFITSCAGGKGTLNCRGLATLLNEVYLAMGFQSRFVTCLPKDTADQDCHVINVVWLPSLRKWVWMDPTFMAYVMDEEGNLLSIEEVRSRLIAKQPLILNPDANWNNMNSQTTNYYLGTYMAKNLYRLECPLHSEYGYEDNPPAKRTYVDLVPANYTGDKSKHIRNGRTYYVTSSPRQYWLPPHRNSSELILKDPSKYVRLLSKYKKCYNNQQADSLNQLNIEPDLEFAADIIMQGNAEFGKLLSFEYLAQDIDDKEVALFKVTYEKSIHVMGISVVNNKIATFRGSTFSPYIDKLLAEHL